MFLNNIELTATGSYRSLWSLKKKELWLKLSLSHDFYLYVYVILSTNVRKIGISFGIRKQGHIHIHWFAVVQFA